MKEDGEQREQEREGEQRTGNKTTDCESRLDQAKREGIKREKERQKGETDLPREFAEEGILTTDDAGSRFGCRLPTH